MAESTKVDKLTVYSEMQLVRRRFNVYLDAAAPFDNAAREVLDNAIDQVQKGRATTVTVTLHQDGSLEVSDDAGTLPTAWQSTPKGASNGIVIALGTLGSSTNYGDATGAGTNGIGAAAANALAKRFDVEVVRDKKRYTQQFSCGVPGVFDKDGNFTEVPPAKLVGKPTQEDNHTTIRVWFDYGNVAPEAPQLDTELLVRRARMSALVTDGTRLIINDLRDVESDLSGTYEGTYGVAPLAEYALGADPSSEVLSLTTEFLGGAKRDTPCSLDLAVYASKEPATVALSNSVFTPDGGSHITGAINGVTRALAERASKLRGLGLARGENPPEAKDFAECLSVAVSMRAPDVRYTGQHKNGVSDAALARTLADQVGSDVTQWALTPANTPMVEKLAKAAVAVARDRRSDEVRKDRRKAAREAKGLGENMSMPEKYIPCQATGIGSNAELHIVEGDSAAGGAKAARNAKNQAIMPLGGILKNAFGKTRDQMRKNAEFQAIETILGCGSYDNCVVENCRFDRIIVATDADAHGKYIASQAICLFYEAFRPLIDAGMIHIAVPPLFVVRDKKTNEVFYQVDEAGRDKVVGEIKAKKHPVEVQRCKGLGEMLPRDYAATMMSDDRILIQIHNDPQAYESLYLQFQSNLGEERREWISDYLDIKGPLGDENDLESRETPLVADAAASEIIPMTITEFLTDAMAIYSVYTIQEQAIPFVSDGMKPSHRRIMYEMYTLGLSPTAKPMKSAKISAATSGDYHPHGDAAIYTTMAGLTRKGERNPLIDGIGNFGYATGDEPASSRYTEARLLPAGWELVRELATGNGGTRMIPSYDGALEEAAVLPARYPVLPISGASGVARGWATKIPSHNPLEIIDLTIALVDNPTMPVSDMLEICPGPDFGEGCTVVGSRDGVESYYDTGRGSFTLRGRIDIVDKRTLRIYEVPAGISVTGKEILGKIKELIRSGNIDATEVSDYSDLDNPVLLEVKLKRGAKPEEVRRQLFAGTKLETSFAANMSGLTDEGIPRVWSLRDMLLEFIALRDQLVTRRSQAEMEKLRNKLPAAEALAAIAVDKETAARLILEADNRDHAATCLADHFQIAPDAAKTIVGLPMYRLTRADALEAQKEVEQLHDTITALAHIIDTPEARKPIIITELEETRGTFTNAARRTTLSYGEPLTQRDTDLGGLGRWKFNTDTGILSDSGVTLTDDTTLWAVFANGAVKLFTGSGLPKTIVDKPIAPDIGNVVRSGILPPETELAIVTRAGRVLRIKDGAVNPQGIAGNGVAGITLDPDFPGGDTIIGAFPVTDEGSILTISGDGYKATKLTDIPSKGRGGKGVNLHTLRKGDAGVVEAEYSYTGFNVDGKPLPGATRSAATKHGVPSRWSVSLP